MEVLAFAIVLGLILAAQSRKEFELAFPAQQCGYCPSWIYWDHKHNVWTHENGNVSAPLPDAPRWNHVALPPYNP